MFEKTSVGSLVLSFLCPFDVSYLNFKRSSFRSDAMYRLFHLRSICRAWQSAMHQQLFPCLDAAWVAKEKARLEKKAGEAPKDGTAHRSRSLQDRQPDRHNAGAWRFLDEQVRRGLSRFSGHVGLHHVREDQSLLVTGASDFNGLYRCSGFRSKVFQNRLTGAVLYHSGGACTCPEGVEGHGTQWCNGKWIFGTGKSSQIVKKAQHENINGKFRVVDMVNEHHKYMNQHGAVMYWSEYKWYIKLSDSLPEPLYTSAGSSDFDLCAPCGVWTAVSGQSSQSLPGSSNGCWVESLHDDCIFFTSSTRNAKNGSALLPPLHESWCSRSDKHCQIVIQEPGPVTPCLTVIRSALWAQNAKTCCAALRCLAKLQPDESTFKEVLDHASHESHEVRHTAISLISDLATQDRVTKHDVAKVLAKCCLQRCDFDIACGSDAVYARISALDCIVGFGEQGFVPQHVVLALLCCLSRQKSMQEQVLRHMPKIAQRGNESARDSILQILDSAKSVEKKGAAMRALSLVASKGDSTAVSAVLAFCGGRTKTSLWSGRSDRSEEVRSDALMALGELCEATDEAALRAIIEGLGDQWACVIHAAEKALGTLAAQDTTMLSMVVREFLDHKSSRVRQQAFSLAKQYIGSADPGIRSYLLK